MSVISCAISADELECTSDHFPLLTKINLYVDKIDDGLSDNDHVNINTFPKPDWKNVKFQQDYKDNINSLLSNIKPININDNNDAQLVVDKYCIELTNVIHESVRLSNNILNI